MAAYSSHKAIRCLIGDVSPDHTQTCKQAYTNNNDATVGINTNAYCPAALTLPAGCYVYRDGFWGNGELILSKTSTVQLEPPSTPPATPPSTPPAQQPEPPASNYTTPVIPSSGSSLLDNMRSAFWGFVAWIRSLFP